jgi:hypothetical protein
MHMTRDSQQIIEKNHMTTFRRRWLQETRRGGAASASRCGDLRRRGQGDIGFRRLGVATGGMSRAALASGGGDRVR